MVQGLGFRAFQIVQQGCLDVRLLGFRTGYSIQEHRGEDLNSYSSWPSSFQPQLMLRLSVQGSSGLGFGVS